MTKPAAPNRAYMTKTLQVGFVPIKLKFMAGVENVKVSRSQYIELPVDTEKDGKPTTQLTKVGQTMATVIGGHYGDIVNPRDVIKLVDTAHGLVEITDEEMNKLLAPGGDENVAEVLAIHPAELYDEGPYMTSGLLYQVRPDKGSEKPYALFLNALKKDCCFALIRYANRGAQYLGALFPDGYVYGLRYSDEIRELAPIPAADVTEGEMLLMQQFVDMLKSKTPQEIEHPHNKVREYAEAKAGDGAPELVVKTTAPLMLDLEKAIAESIASIQAAKQAVNA